MMMAILIPSLPLHNTFVFVCQPSKKARKDSDSSSDSDDYENVDDDDDEELDDREWRGEGGVRRLDVRLLFPSLSLPHTHPLPLPLSTPHTQCLFGVCCAVQEIDKSNIISGSRRRARVDYSKFNDEDDEDDDDE